MLFHLRLKYFVIITCLSGFISLTTSQNNFSLDDCNNTENNSQKIGSLELGNSALCIIMPIRRISNIDVEFTAMVENFNIEVHIMV